MYNKVFISHAKEDYFIAERIYNFLLQTKFSPWLDKKVLRVGSNWDYEIKKSLKDSDFVILLLSSTSVRKRGYVQKEFKYAVEYSESKLIDDIYILPILIDECEVPEHLKKFQWIKLDEKDILDKILDSLTFQREKYLDEISADLIDINDYSNYNIELKLNLPFEVDYECNLPLFRNNNFFDANFVNTFIHQKPLKYISELRNWVNEDREFFEQRDVGFYLDISHTIKMLDKENLSLTIFYNSFFGGAHPSTSIDTLNFAFNPERLLKLRDIVEYPDLESFLKEKIENYGTEEQKETLPSFIEYIDSEIINFVFNKEKIEIDFTNQIPRVIMAIGSLEFPRTT